MTLASGLESSGGVSALKALYDSTLEPYLAARDAPLLAARRRRWLVLAVGLTIAAGVLVWAIQSTTDNEFGPMVAFGLVVGSAGYFWLSRAALADDVRHELMSRIAVFLGLRYEPSAAGFDLERFALLGLAAYDKARRTDRLFGEAGGLAVDMMAARLADETSTGIGSERQTRTIERFSGLLVRIRDPMPQAADTRFRLVPPAGASDRAMLRDISIVTHTSSSGQPMPSMADLERMLTAGPEAAPRTPTGDAAFDARFELHALGPAVPAALARLDAGTRGALLDIASCFGGGAVSVGFDGGDILLAFVTQQRFEIGPLRPPMAQFERVRHLAEQMGILTAIADRLRTARETDAARPAPA